jgi:CcmD family protein
MKELAIKPLIALLIMSAIFLSFAAIPALAQQDISAQANNGGSSDAEANLPYLFAVYAITWVIFFAYLYYLSQRQRNLRREVEELRQVLAERESKAEGP